jgi:hypothetical protein
MKAVRKQERDALSRFGAFVRQRAKTSIKRSPVQPLKEMTDDERKRFKARVAIAKHYGKPVPKRPRKQSSSRPGQPPLSQVGLLRKFIIFAYDFENASVVIGPMKLNTPTMAPMVLEHGGRTHVSRLDKTVNIQPRPYMNPAFEAELPEAAAMWADSIKR